MSQSKLNFSKVTAHEAQQYRQLIAEQLAAAAAATTSPPPPPPVKRPVGRPKRAPSLSTALGAATEIAAEGEERAKKRGKYTSWFDSPFLTDILAAYRQQGCSARKAVDFLRRSSPDPSRYARLSHSTIASWFDEHNKLLPRFQQQYDESAAAVRSEGRPSAFQKSDGGSEVEAEMKRVLLALREQGVPLNSRVIKWVMTAIIDEMCPEIHRHTSLSKKSISRWVRAQMGWTWRSSTTAASKLPHSWEEDGIKMAMRIGANMERYSVSTSIAAAALRALKMVAIWMLTFSIFFSFFLF
jgi:hypothetical protein